MTFELTEELYDKIQHALDNQEHEFAVNAKIHDKENSTCDLVQISEGIQADEKIIYKLPEWNTTNGFLLMEEFVNSLHNPFAKEELRECLHSGRGVFKNFKIVLKDYPEVEKKWHLFKNKKMRFFINEWYNDLREIWGLEKLDLLTETDDSLLHDDFTFSEYNKKIHEEEIILALKSNNFAENAEINSALYALWRQNFENAKTDGKNQFEQTGFVCRSISDEFAGCITVSEINFEENARNTVYLSCYFVPLSFRGLGIGTELLSMCIAKLKTMKKKWLLLPNIVMPDIVLPLLTRMGFEKIGSGYAVKL